MEDTAATQALKKSVEKPLAKMVTAVAVGRWPEDFASEVNGGRSLKYARRRSLLIPRE